MKADREAEIRMDLSTGPNAEPSCQDCNEHILLREVDRLRADLEFAAAFWRPVTRDMEHDILSVQTVRLMAQDFLAELHRRSALV